MKSLPVKSAFIFLCVLLLAACGGGGSSGSVSGGVVDLTKTLTGTAAAGAPIIGYVTVKDSSDPQITKTVEINADGIYSVNVDGMTAPFMLKATGKVGFSQYTLCSVALAADVNNNINITPFTDLIVSDIADGLADAYFEGGDFSGLTEQEINTARDSLKNLLEPVLTSIGLSSSFDLLRTTFAANHEGLDAVLDVIKVSTNKDLMIAEIRNIITDNSLTIDIETGLVEGELTEDDGTAVAAAKTDLDTIMSRFTAFNNLYDGSVPSSANTTLNNLVAKDGSFLWGGQDVDDFLNQITASNDLEGLSFVSVNLLSLDTSAGTAEASFQMAINGRLMIDAGYYTRLKKIGGVWKIQGDGFIASAWVGPQATCEVTNSNDLHTGLKFEFKDGAGYGVAYVIVEGPGLPEDGLMIKKLPDDDSFQIYVNGNYIGYLYEPDETSMDEIPEYNVRYEFSLYDTDNNLLQAMWNNLAAKPIPSEDLTTGDFGMLTSNALNLFNNFAGGANATINLAWTLPDGKESSSIYMAVSGSSNNFAEVEESFLSAASTSKTLNLATGFTPTQRRLTLTVRDRERREYSATYRQGFN